MLQDRKSVFYQGAPGAFSEAAAKLLIADKLGGDTEVSGCSTFELVAGNACASANRYGVLPLENSTIGAIVQSYDLLRTLPLQILAELYLPIRHCLLARKGTLIDDVREVYSHPVALQQCKRFFKEHPRLVPIECFDTGGAADFVAGNEDNNFAAIAREEAAQLYGLEVLQFDLQDFPHNATRFVLVSSQSATNITEPGAATVKVSIMFEAGAKHPVLPLHFLCDLSCEVQSIVSRPIQERGWTYAVFVDVLCPAVQLPQLQQLDNIRILGVYAPASR